jgi:hypothetical protein
MGARDEVELILRSQPERRRRVTSVVLTSLGVIQRGRVVVAMRLRSCVLLVEEPDTARPGIGRRRGSIGGKRYEKD